MLQAASCGALAERVCECVTVQVSAWIPPSCPLCWRTGGAMAGRPQGLRGKEAEGEERVERTAKQKEEESKLHNELQT